MKTIILLTAIALSVTACGSGGGSDSSSHAPAQTSTPAAVPAPASTPASSTPIPLCTDVQRCVDVCAADYPFMTDVAIERQCVVTYGYPSGACTKILNQNHLNYDNYNACLAKPANQVVSYP